MFRTLGFTAAVAGVLMAGCASDQKAFRSNDELAQKTTAAPAVNVPAHVTRATEVRSSPHDNSPVLYQLPQGTEVLATGEASRGWRRVKAQDGKSGYVPDVALQVDAHAAPASPSAEQAQPDATAKP